ncbi:NAD(P)/FAD-dependent oxidoreductase [Ralstonia solanacearum]|uniref:Amino acid dehydrogenase n=2 Tax=Ralstonia solanacearum TaxID=305 RepID=A0A5H2PXD4_RALSL|nr:FAD-binding oxidoreductase [Ralstonia solanacearum]AEG72225.1 d-amino acid dehydrogenase subunit [Ralstonia solanacearum Po82]AMP71229.1 amino acid dehydrogenase [Ralstonia solanacearum]AMP75769.1 amino acid dehydrogenase [Ralstonia solanacearum]AYB63436.1 amino acid dehydrogenase [Ralstonia solanacearum]EUJ11985.1 D-amino acid dehydrogenase [Ralstonia solanacearum P673]
MRFDTLVLGAGIVGVSVAVHLQQRGRAVALVDRKAPGNETSYGNAGLIQREGVYPYAFPRDLGTLLRYATNTSADVRYHAADLPRLLPFLWRYWRCSHPARHAAIARAYAPLIEHCVTEHRALAEAAGVAGLLRPIGWMKVFRSAATQDAATRDAERWNREYGVTFEALDPARLRAAEPHLDPALLGGLHYTDSDSCSDPHALVSAYTRYFEQLGGRLFAGDASTLTGSAPWCVRTAQGELRADNVVVAMGPWSEAITSRLGYRLPLAVKRGYHMHYAPAPGAQLNHAVLDADGGYVLVPMARGIRLTTGAELARCDAPKTPAQLDAVEPVARRLFPLDGRIDAEPWMGARPCTPDMLPIIGPAPRHGGLWFAFGHAHHGLTLGPITGRLIAEMMTGATPIVDVRPFGAERF